MSIIEKIAVTALLVAWMIGAIRTLFENRQLKQENRELRHELRVLLTWRASLLEEMQREHRAKKDHY